ncbi:undecaprenyl-phosphate 4-deoxy-4-formamido-L-arabinose transferase [bacterium BMS3Abin04]|nr:undecaprenyl-phosphate 4-deoxy-4-formamido-L-arabinose transferase [bacterium BMS3Abin04]
MNDKIQKKQTSNNPNNNKIKTAVSSTSSNSSLVKNNTAKGGKQAEKTYHPKRKYYKRNYNRKPRKPGSEKIINNIKQFRFKKISVVIPLLNEEESIRPLVDEINNAVSTISPDHEILFIDDGSTDNSLKIIKDLARTNKKIRYISFRKNYGKSAALNVGFKNAIGDVIITMDADLQDDPDEIPNLLSKLEEGYDLVSGWKKKRFDPFVKKHSSRFFNFVTGILTGIKIHDFNCGLKAYRKEVVGNIDVHGELHRYIPVMAYWKGFRVSEIVVKHHPRRYGKTKFGVSRFFKGFVDLITVIFTTRYIQRPMHLFGLVGGLFFFLGVLVDGFLAYEWLFHSKYINNRPLFFLGILLIIVGIQFFSVGLLGEIMVHNSNFEEDYNIKEKK